jgi:membrane protein DedA with SNARE-associated domain
MQNIVYPLIIVFLTGMLGIWKAVPVGLAFNLHPVFIWLLTSAGASCAVFILYFFGKQIRAYILRKRGHLKHRRKEVRATKLLEKYGVFGLGFFGTLLMGPIMTIAIGLVIVKSHKKLLYSTLAGIFTWSLVLTYLGLGGIDLARKLNELF